MITGDISVGPPAAPVVLVVARPLLVGGVKVGMAEKVSTDLGRVRIATGRPLAAMTRAAITTALAAVTA
jgi:hypothetical protein